MMTINVFCILAASIPLNMALECFVCNNKPGDDDSKPCLDQNTDNCPDSCSAVYYQTMDKILHVRKFCTAPGTSMNRRALLSPGSAMCENVNTLLIVTSCLAHDPTVTDYNRFKRESLSMIRDNIGRGAMGDGTDDVGSMINDFYRAKRGVSSMPEGRKRSEND